VYQILSQVRDILKKTPPLIDIQFQPTDQFTICGDTHGQYYDLLNIFQLAGLPSTTNPILFNGDFVDRGSFSAEVILTLFAFKILLPNHFHLTRGNHESKSMNRIYGFEGEIKAKYLFLSALLLFLVYLSLPLLHIIGMESSVTSYLQKSFAAYH